MPTNDIKSLKERFPHLSDKQASGLAAAYTPKAREKMAKNMTLEQQAARAAEAARKAREKAEIANAREARFSERMARAQQKLQRRTTLEMEFGADPDNPGGGTRLPYFALVRKVEDLTLRVASLERELGVGQQPQNGQTA